MRGVLKLVAELIVLVAVVGALSWVWKGDAPEIAAVEPADPASFPSDVVDLVD